jgi:hypothetical protein
MSAARQGDSAPPAIGSPFVKSENKMCTSQSINRGGDILSLMDSEFLDEHEDAIPQWLKQRWASRRASSEHCGYPFGWAREVQPIKSFSCFTR